MNRSFLIGLCGIINKILLIFWFHDITCMIFAKDDVNVLIFM